MDWLKNPVFAVGKSFGPITIRVAQTPKWAPGAHTYGKRQKCISDEPGGGQTNGMPWDGTSPVSEGTVIDAPRPTPVPRSDPNTPIWAWDLEKSWATAQNPFFKIGWLGLSTKLEEASNEIVDPEFSGELRLLAQVAYQRYLNA